MQERQMNASELRLAEISDLTEGEKRDEWHSDPPDSCDYCSKGMSESVFSSTAKFVMVFSGLICARIASLSMARLSDGGPVSYISR